MGSSHSQPSRPQPLKHHKSAPFLARKFNDDERTSLSSAPSFDNSEKVHHRAPAYTKPINVALAQHIAYQQPPPPPLPRTPQPSAGLQLYLPSPTAGLLPSGAPVSPADAAYAHFLQDYPEYAATWPLDALRLTEYTRLASDHAYLDYMGGALYPASLISVHAAFLTGAVLGNTHSESDSSKLSSALADAARAAVLAFFNAPPGSSVVFTANASSALKLVGEAFPFTQGSTYLLPEDAHNSVHGIREFARAKGGHAVYLPAGPTGGVRVRETIRLLDRHRPGPDGPAALFAYTGLSNLTNTKAPLSVLAHARARGYTTLLDAAALAPTTPLDLTATPADAVAISFYKMFGYPTGIGALILAPGVGEKLIGGRPWFAGGNVEVVQVPGTLITRKEGVEGFEDGTINYTLLPGVTTGLRLLGAYLPFLPARIAALTSACVGELQSARWPNGAPAVRVLSRIPNTGRARRHRATEDDADDEGSGSGGVISCIFLDSTGASVPLSRIATHAAAYHIALRTGCMCNPGGAAALLGLRSLMAQLAPGDTLADMERKFDAGGGTELGVVRLSFGLASAWSDVWKVGVWVRNGVADGWAVRDEVGRAF
ncbi:PLP-dependent transferase [Artomyces pyxidatus]|uniref:PLP-dependent transferase n=1 Tax=Artomyces pyxidatus TaxID=48021 RepID=A0ACB8T1C8_9AGAM|nr:PLP-dependent transferase [Artomyces pyxidatus]